MVRNLILAALLATLLVAPPAARADGDPASDYLISQTVFFPFDTTIPRAQQERLFALTANAAKKGYPIRVALISSRYDLGSVTILWGAPQRYATFLSREDLFVFKGPLLVVMPHGLGFWWPNHETTAQQKLIRQIRVPPGQTGLATAAENAVQRLAAASGVHVTADATSASHRNRNDRLIIIVAVVAALGLGLIVRNLLRRRRRA